MGQFAGAELIDACIERIWNEHDGEKRRTAIGDIYHLDACLYEPAGATIGHEAIAETAESVLADMPAEFRFRLTDETVSGHNDMAVTRWQWGPPGTTILSGTNAMRFADGKIREHWCFFDPAS